MTTIDHHDVLARSQRREPAGLGGHPHRVDHRATCTRPDPYRVEAQSHVEDGPTGDPPMNRWIEPRSGSLSAPRFRPPTAADLELAHPQGPDLDLAGAQLADDRVCDR